VLGILHLLCVAAGLEAACKGLSSQGVAPIVPSVEMMGVWHERRCGDTLEHAPLGAKLLEEATKQHGERVVVERTIRTRHTREAVDEEERLEQLLAPRTLGFSVPATSSGPGAGE
jgi:hypothetical protein